MERPNILVNMLAATPLPSESGGRSGLGQLAPPTVADDITYARYLERMAIAEASSRAFAQQLMLEKNNPKANQLGQLMMRRLNQSLSQLHAAGRYYGYGLGGYGLGQSSGGAGRANAAMDELDKELGAMRQAQAQAANGAVTGSTARANTQKEAGLDTNLAAGANAAGSVPAGSEKAVEGKSATDAAARLNKATGGTQQIMSQGVQAAAGANPISAVLVAAVTPFAQEAAKLVGELARAAASEFIMWKNDWEFEDAAGAGLICEARCTAMFGGFTPLAGKYLIAGQTASEINEFRACGDDEAGAWGGNCSFDSGSKAEPSSDFVRNESVVLARLDKIKREATIRKNLSLLDDAERQAYKRDAALKMMMAFISTQTKAACLVPGIYRNDPSWAIMTPDQQNVIVKEILPAQLEFVRSSDARAQDRLDAQAGIQKKESRLALYAGIAAGVLAVGGGGYYLYKRSRG